MHTVSHDATETRQENPFKKEYKQKPGLVLSNHELPKKTAKTTTKNEVTIEGKALSFFSANGKLGDSRPLKPVYPERLLDNQEEPYEALVHFR